MILDELQAIYIVEGLTKTEPTTAQTLEAWQWLISNGKICQYNGWYRRNALRLIKAGVCHA